MVLVLQQQPKALSSRTRSVFTLDLHAEGPQSCQCLFYEMLSSCKAGEEPWLLSLIPPEAVPRSKRDIWKQACSQNSFHQRQAQGGRESLPMPPRATVISCFWEALRMAPPRESSVFPVINAGIYPRLPAAGGCWAQAGSCLAWLSPSPDAPCSRGGFACSCPAPVGHVPAELLMGFAALLELTEHPAVLPVLPRLVLCHSWSLLLLLFSAVSDFALPFPGAVVDVDWDLQRGFFFGRDYILCPTSEKKSNAVFKSVSLDACILFHFLGARPSCALSALPCRAVQTLCCPFTAGLGDGFAQTFPVLLFFLSPKHQTASSASDGGAKEKHFLLIFA